MQMSMQQEGTKRLSRDLILQYVGKDIVLELGDIGMNVCSGFLEKYDGKHLDLVNFKQHICSLDKLYRSYVHPYDLTSPASVKYSLPRRTINNGIVASIQSLEDVLKAQKDLEDVLKAREEIIKINKK